MVNPDGIVLGNYRTNLQGKDMNRNFSAYDDPEAMKKAKCFEVELIREYIRTNLPMDHSLFRMFLDVHAHSTETSIFIYSPQPPEGELRDVVATRHFPLMLDEMSDSFLFRKCSYNNDKAKKNCARLGMNRDYGLANSYTVESSVWGYEKKDKKRTT